jgi:diguanylate cyclase (GGDEF)-like protein
MTAWVIGARHWLQRRSLRERIAASLAGLIFTLAAILGGIIGQSAIDQARERVEQSLATDAQRLAERLNTELAARSRELGLLASTDVVQYLPSTITSAPGLGVVAKLTPTLAHTQSLLDSLRHSFPSYVAISVADTNGRVLASTDPAILGTEVSTRESGRDLRRGPVTGISDFAAPSPTIDLFHPIRGTDGTVVGVIVAKLAWSWVRMIERTVVTSDSDGVLRHETFLINNLDVVVLGPPGSVGQSVALSVANRARAGFFGASVEQWPDGGPFLTGTALVALDGQDQGTGPQSLRWVVLIREGQDSAFASAYALRAAIWIAGIVIAASFAAIGWFLAGMISAPLARIANAAERLRQGDDIEIPRLRGPAEIETLSTSLRAMVATLTRKQIALDEMEELALRDPLTGLLNRHGLRIVIEQLMERAKAEAASLLIFVGDLDGFKAVNDTLGHASGDQLLCQVANRIARSARGSDVVARLGGDEFVLALLAPHGSDDTEARAVAHRVQAAIAAPYMIDGVKVQVGCSLGGATWPEDVAEHDGVTLQTAEFDEVLERADAALYRVKRSEKGRIEVHQGLLRRIANVASSEH